VIWESRAREKSAKVVLGSGLIDPARLECSTVSKDAPGNARELVGERDGEDVVMQPLLGRLEPRLEPVTMPTFWLD
jgi:hypothetical protein